MLPDWLFGRRRSALLVETATGVVCGGFADESWRLEGGPVNEEISSTYFVLQHPSGVTRKWTATGSSAHYVTAGRHSSVCFGDGQLAIYERGYLRTSASGGLSEENAVFICCGGQDGDVTRTEILRWEFWHV
jgi:hypothetical protein